MNDVTEMPMPPVGTCTVCGATDRPVDGSGCCYQCFEDAMFAEDEEAKL